MQSSVLQSGLPSTTHDTGLTDILPTGVLIYRFGRPVYANKAFLDGAGCADLRALGAAGGLDALRIKSASAWNDPLSEQGTAVKLAIRETTFDARIHDITWQGEAARALIVEAQTTSQPAAPLPAPVDTPLPSDAVAEELGTILDATDDGILIFTADGRIVTCNRGAEVLFGYNDRDISQYHLTDLFAAENHSLLRSYFDGIKNKTQAGRQNIDVTGRDRSGRAPELMLTIGRTTSEGGRFFAICRPLAQSRDDDAAEQMQAKRQSDRAANARSGILARISHEVRTPLSAIIGFADVMIHERFGPLNNERYAAYMKDIRAAGERVLAIINDLLDLSNAETGKLDLTFTRQDLNDMVEKCVTAMQPQANRERIIIRTSLAHALPQVTADAGALRQIVFNLVGNSIHVARAGGQVIVSTALTDLGDVVLRVRDSAGRGLNQNEMEAALEQFRNPESDQLAQDNAGINLSLTKALVEANMAQFHIKSAPQSGTLVEIAFSQKVAQAV